MSFLYSNQPLKFRTKLEGVPSNTPSLHFYADAISTGSPVLGTAGTDFPTFDTFVPELPIATRCQFFLSCTIAGVNIFRPVLEGTIVQLTDETLIEDIADDFAGIKELIKGGQIAYEAPVTPQGTIKGPLVIGDDYLAERAFRWYINPPAYPIGEAEAIFGGYSRNSGRWLIDAVIAPATIDGEPKWELLFEMPNNISSTLKPSTFSYSVSTRHASTGTVTRAFGEIVAIQSYSAFLG
jgi:hypothetical protein